MGQSDSRKQGTCIPLSFHIQIDCKEVLGTYTYNMKIQNYIELLEEIQGFAGDQQSALAILHEMNEDRRAEKRSDGQNGEATEKQRNYLKKLNVECPVELSKAEASRLIDGAHEAN